MISNVISEPFILRSPSNGATGSPADTATKTRPPLKFILQASILTLFLIGCEPSAEVQTVRSETAERPNILFVIADDASYPHFGVYGSDWVQTPAFDRVAEDGVLFMNAYTPNAKCAPSRAAILTGRNSWQLEEAGNHVAYFPQKFKTYVEVLEEAGYFVGHTGKGWAPGVAEIDGQRRHLAGPPFVGRTTDPPATEMSNKDYAANFDDFLDQVPEGQPFSFWFGAHEPHRGYEYGSGAGKGGKRLTDIEEVYAFWPDNDTVRTDILDYAFEVEYFDDHLQRMLALLEARGQLGNTLVVVTSDNGMPFPRIKGQEYELSNHMPLAVMWPAGIRKSGRVVSDYVSFIDFAPTFLEVAGIDPDAGGMQPITGRSLTDILYSSAEGQVNAARDHVLIGKERHDVGRPDDVGYPIRGIVSDGFLFLKNFESDRWPAGNPETGYLNCDGGPTKTVCLNARRNPETHAYWALSFGKRADEELYDVRTDPACMHNLVVVSEYERRKSAMREQLFRELESQADPRIFGKGDVFDKYVYADDKTRDFYNRYMQGEDVKAGWVNKSDFESDILPGGL